MSALKEECGVLGIYAPEGNVAELIYYGLNALQHRGQEACGIAVNKNRDITHYKDLGLVNNVFDEDRLRSLEGNMGVGHVRYSTAGGNLRENAQPLTLRYIKGNLALVHNGNLINANELRHEYEQNGAIYQTTADTEIIAYTIARQRALCGRVEEAVSRTMKILKGSYSLIIMSPKKLIAARDPWGFRPLCMGKAGDMIVFASESCGLDAVGAEYIRELDPGEIVVVEDGKIKSIRDNCGGPSNICIFEYIYFARTDSVINNQLVNDSRRLAGMILAEEHPCNADIVVGVPDSGLPAARGYSQYSGIPRESGIVKNRYIARTFIKPTQLERQTSVSLKLNPVRKYVEGKSIVLVDDSIVRSTTITRIIQTMRNAGAREVHVRISSPPFLWPCYFGTDIPNRDSLISAKYNVEETSKHIGADSLGYLPLERLKDIIPDCNEQTFCQGCFTGKYPLEVNDPVLKG